MIGTIETLDFEICAGSQRDIPKRVWQERFGAPTLKIGLGKALQAASW